MQPSIHSLIFGSKIGKIYSECSLFTIVNWFFFLALDEGGCSSNIVFNQFNSRHYEEVHTSQKAVSILKIYIRGCPIRKVNLGQPL